MKKKLFVLLILCIGAIGLSAADFVCYYNQASHWQGEIGNGTLIIDQRVDLNDDVHLPKTVDIEIVGDGEFYTNGYEFRIRLTNLFENEYDPCLLYKEKVKVIMTIINTILL